MFQISHFYYGSFSNDVMTVKGLIPKASHRVTGLRVFIITSPQGQPHAVFGGFISVAGGWLLLCQEPIVAEGGRSPCNNAAVVKCCLMSSDVS